MVERNQIKEEDWEATIGETKVPEGLTEMQAQACREFIKDLNQKQALIRAGYKENFAAKKSAEVFKKAEVQQYIKALQKTLARRTGISPEEVVRRIMRIATHAEQEGEWNAALRGMELLGRHLAMFTDKQQVEHSQNPWATGDKPEDIERDIENLKRVAAPKLKVVNGGKDPQEK